MSTVDEALGVGKQLARDIRALVHERLNHLPPTDKAIAGYRVVSTLRDLAREVDGYTVPRKAVEYDTDTPTQEWKQVDVDVVVNQGIIIPINKEIDNE